jgi:hypothetical protein
MTSRDFCFWLQGFLELRAAETPGVNHAQGLCFDQLECVRRHLALVFKHEIDPSMGTPAHQVVLNDIHSPIPGPGPTMRC